MKPMTELEKHYNKFTEDKRLQSRHGQVEFHTSMHYIHQCLAGNERAKILDVGAGTGRYSIALAAEGHDVTAVELVRYNLGILKKNAREQGVELQAYQGNAKKLSRFEAETFDLTLVFGPMYHLFTMEEKIQVLQEAKRVTRTGGVILVAYCMNEYGVLSYGFKEGHVLECLADGRLDENFHCRNEEKDLYDYMRLEDIDAVNAAAGLSRLKIISADGPADYMRQELRAMSEEVFETFLRYQLSVCERPELVGAGAHTVDILRKEE